MAEERQKPLRVRPEAPELRAPRDLTKEEQQEFVDLWRSRCAALARPEDAEEALPRARSVFGRRCPIVFCWSPLAALMTIAVQSATLNQSTSESLTGADEIDLILDAVDEFMTNASGIAIQKDYANFQEKVLRPEPLDVYDTLDGLNPTTNYEEIISQAKTYAQIAFHNVKSIYGKVQIATASHPVESVDDLIKAMKEGKLDRWLVALLEHGWMDDAWNKCKEYGRCCRLHVLAELGAPMQSFVKDYLELSSRVAAMWLVNGTWYLIANPSVVRFDDRNRFHSVDRPAIEWHDGTDLYFIGGVQVPRQIVLSPKRYITMDKIAEQENLELRRIMIERYGEYGLASYLEAVGAEEIAKDDWGVLYRWQEEAGNGRNMDIWAVLVTNSTREPDGTYKKYALKVDPQCRPMTQVRGRNGQIETRFGSIQNRTPLNAIASTFGMTGKEYAEIKRQT